NDATAGGTVVAGFSRMTVGAVYGRVNELQSGIWLRHQLKLRSHRSAADGARSASAVARSRNTRSASAVARSRNTRSASATARSRNSGQFGEMFRPEQLRRTDHPGRAVSERIHFIDGASTPPFQGGEYCSIPIHSQLHRPRVFG